MGYIDTIHKEAVAQNKLFEVLGRGQFRSMRECIVPDRCKGSFITGMEYGYRQARLRLEDKRRRDCTHRGKSGICCFGNDSAFIKCAIIKECPAGGNNEYQD